MALESANFIDGLVITNPPGTDLKSQGDDHLQLIKKVLKNTFPNATRPYPLPVTVVVSGSGAVLATQQNALIVVANGAAMNLTMPTLVTADAGWSVTVLKLPGSVGPLFVLPPSGTIMSGQATVAKARRSIPGIMFQVLWTGSNWVCGRCINAPIGSVIPFFTSSLPIGFEWPNGQALSSSTDYPEYFSIVGSVNTPDLKQRSLFGSNLGGSDPSRITSVLSAAMGSVGGHQLLHQHNHTGTSGNQSVDHSHDGSTGVESAGHTHGINVPLGLLFSGGIGATAGPTGLVGGGSVATTGANDTTHTHSFTTLGSSTGHTHTISSDGGGNQQNIPPCAVCNYALVVE